MMVGVTRRTIAEQDRQRERKGYPNDIRDNGRKKQSKERKNNRGVERYDSMYSNKCGKGCQGKIMLGEVNK